MPIHFDGIVSRADIAEIAALEELVFDDQERIAILESMRSIDVQACPGSGKTTLIAAKLILLARKWPVQHQGICVLSHTNVAKDEIIDRIKKSRVAEAQRLLAFPHFIGTIQELVNRFLAIPYLRSKGIDHITVDNSEYVKAANRLLLQNQFRWVRGMLQGLGDYQDSFLSGTFRDLDGNITTNRNARTWIRSMPRIHADLARLKSCLDERGFFLFRDMYTYAQFALIENQSLGRSIANRFPFVLIDEMQDTQKFQDSLLHNIFSDDWDVVTQRFGDPDQAIFSGISGEEPNESYNSRAADQMIVINKSHRFGGDVASKIKGLSFNCVNLESDLSENTVTERITQACNGTVFNHTVIIFNDDNVGLVVPTFANLVSQQFSLGYKTSKSFTVKIVGAVGNQLEVGADQLKIGHYWSNFDKTRTSRSFKESSLIDALRFCHQSPSADWADSYNFLKSCFLKVLRAERVTDSDGRHFSPKTLRRFLKDSGKWERYRKLMYTLLCGGQINEEGWRQVRDELCVIFSLDQISPDVDAYLAFVAEDAGCQPEVMATVAENVLFPTQQNSIVHPDGFKIELSTIHGVKGETHDATLVLETKNHCFDIGTMVQYLTHELPDSNSPNSALREGPAANARVKQNRKFMRLLYVAVSRPKHLMCLAIHTDRVSDDQRATLRGLGWDLLELPLPGVTE